MTAFNVGEYSVSTIASSVGTDNRWAGLFSISKVTENEEQLVTSLRRTPGSFTNTLDAISGADEAARAFIAGL